MIITNYVQNTVGLFFWDTVYVLKRHSRVRATLMNYAGIVTVILKLLLLVLVQACKDHMLLKSTLSQVELECQAARTQVTALQRKLHALELEVQVRTHGGVVVRVSDLGSKGPGFDPRVVPKSECMFVNIYHY